MDPTVGAAWIAAGVSVLTLTGTLAAQYLGYRAASRNAEKTAEEQRKQAKEQSSRGLQFGVDVDLDDRVRARGPQSAKFRIWILSPPRRSSQLLQV